MPDPRAADVLYNSEAALRLVMSELGELSRQRDTPEGTTQPDGAAPPGQDLDTADRGPRHVVPPAS